MKLLFEYRPNIINIILLQHYAPIIDFIISIIIIIQLKIYYKFHLSNYL